MIINLPTSVTGLTKNIYYNLENDTIGLHQNNESIVNFIDLNNTLSLSRRDTIKPLSSEYEGIIETLNIRDVESVLWANLLGKNVLRSKMLNIVAKARNVLSDQIVEYLNVLRIREQFTKSFEPGYFNKLGIKSRYDHITSLTGRVKIISGYNYLVMKQSTKKNLKSVFKDGRIYEIDVVSLEPRVLLREQGLSKVDDVYNDTIQRLSLDCDRKSMKLGVLASIYGGKARTIKKISGLTGNDIQKIKDYFEVVQLNKKLDSQLKQTGRITNMYGRPIYKPTNLINNYIQSSAADCACLAFHKLLKIFKDKKINVVAFVHDSIIIDSHPSYFDLIEQVSSVFEDKLGVDLPIKLTRVT